MEKPQTLEKPQTRKLNLAKKKTMKRGVLPLSRLYGEISGYDIGSSAQSDYSITYGEVKESSIPILYEIFNTYAPLNKISSPFRTFYDLGSGIGKLVFGMSYLNSTLKSIGIEIVSERVQVANSILQKIKDINVKKRIEFLRLSMLDESINYSDACWIFLSNLTWFENHNDALFNKLAKEVKTGCIIVCSRQTKNVKFKQLNHITLPMSWANDSKVYVYTKID